MMDRCFWIVGLLAVGLGILWVIGRLVRATRQRREATQWRLHTRHQLAVDYVQALRDRSARLKEYGP